MVNYIKQSFRKFKTDALSKVFYDLIKWIIILFGGLIVSDYLPIAPLGDFLQKSYTFSTYSILLCSLSLILSTVLVLSVFYYRRYRNFKEQSQIDELTGLRNHKALEEYLNEKIGYSNEKNSSFSIILIDIDNFKSFNTQYGYNTADEILSEVGKLLGRDKRATDETFRKFSRGDEFVVVANDTCLADAIKAADRKRNLISNTSFYVEEKPYKLTVSCGVTDYKIGVDTYQSLTDRVSKALVEAKECPGKNSTRSNT